MSDEEEEICDLCNKPVLEGQARNGVTGNHWDCWEQLQNQVKADAKKFSDPALKRMYDDLIRKLEDPLA